MSIHSQTHTHCCIKKSNRSLATSKGLSGRLSPRRLQAYHLVGSFVRSIKTSCSGGKHMAMLYLEAGSRALQLLLLLEACGPSAPQVSTVGAVNPMHTGYGPTRGWTFGILRRCVTGSFQPGCRLSGRQQPVWHIAGTSVRSLLGVHQTRAWSLHGLTGASQWPSGPPASLAAPGVTTASSVECPALLQHSALPRCQAGRRAHSQRRPASICKPSAAIPAGRQTAKPLTLWPNDSALRS